MLILWKAKYTKRWKGKDGKWHYSYGAPSDSKPVLKDIERARGKKTDTSKLARELHSEAIDSKGSLTVKKAEANLEDARAELSIHRSGNNYQRFEANIKRLMSLPKEQVAHEWQSYNKIKSKLPDVERKAYTALFKLYIAKYMPGEM